MVLTLHLSGCGGPSGAPPDGRYDVLLKTQDFIVKGQYFPPASGQLAPRLWVVIEGDGARWTGGQPPADPTPRHAVGPALLAVAPQTDARLYLARPCQYLTRAELADCSVDYWTSKRFAPSVIGALDQVISRTAKPGQGVILVGFSGGGVVAAELALDRPDLCGLITIAAPLDLELWTEFHHVDPLLSPTPPARLLAGLSRLKGENLNLYGESDTVVPMAATRRVRRVLAASSVRLIPGFHHSSDWPHLLDHQQVFASFSQHCQPPRG